MYVSKTKTYNIPLDSIKEHLKVYDNTDDEKIKTLVKSVVGGIEQECSIDLVPTVNTLEDYGFCGSCYRIFEQNISISSIQYTNDLAATPVSGSVGTDQYTIRKGFMYTDLVFKASVRAERLNIVYSSGYSTIPVDLIQAIKLKTAYFYDVDENNTIRNDNESKSYARLIAPYKNILV